MLITQIRSNINPFKPCYYFMDHQVYYPKILHPAHSVLFICFVWISEQTAIISPTQHELVGFYNWDSVFTARYALNIRLIISL
jgi:hypothetical protein